MTGNNGSVAKFSSEVNGSVRVRKGVKWSRVLSSDAEQDSQQSKPDRPRHPWLATELDPLLIMCIVSIPCKVRHAPKRAVSFGQPYPLLYCSVILFDHVVQVPTLAQADTCRQHACGFQRPKPQLKSSTTLIRQNKNPSGRNSRVPVLPVSNGASPVAAALGHRVGRDPDAAQRT